jgi:Xaa-Pro aminopeptidase
MRRLALLSLVGVLLPAADGIPQSEYRDRRDALRESIQGGVLILVGNTEKERGDLRSPFFQEANFLYLTGWREPGAILVMAPGQEALFIPRRDPERERWTGRKTAPEDTDASAVTGFEQVLPAEEFEARLPELAKSAAKVYTLTGLPAGGKLKALLPLREFADIAGAVARLRMKKSEAELALIRKATEVTMNAHRAAWRRLAGGLFEYQLAAAASGVYFEAGCERHAYPPIVGSGPNAVVLHYNANSRRVDEGELVLMDIGAECAGYASDITRTVPAGGKFSARQRELYEIVLGAQKAVIEAVKPGMTLARSGPNSLHLIAVEYFNQHGKGPNGEALGKYFTHGIGHHVGLEVHDANDPARALEAGMVITVEPGLYIPEEGIGIRIEDMVVVTENGAEVISTALPKEAAEVEGTLQKGG